MHEDFEGKTRILVSDCLDLLQGEFTSQDDTTETLIAKPFRLLRGTGITLGAGMKFTEPSIVGSDFRQHAHVLQEDGIDTYLVEFGNHLQCVFQLIVIDDGVDGDVNLRLKLVGVVTKLLDVFQRVAGCRACPETRGTDIDGIGSMLDGSDTAL